MTTPDRLVEGGRRHYGRFDRRIRDTNPSDAYRGLSAAWHEFRLKEWVGFTLVHPEISGAFIMQDVKYLASSELYVRDRSTGVLVEKRASFRGGSIGLPHDLLHGGRCRATKPGYRLEYDFDLNADDEGTIRIRIDCADDEHGPAIKADLTLLTAGATPALSFSGRITRSIDYYTFKQPFPVAGTILVGDRAYELDPGRDFAIIDENRSSFPYSTHWTWGTFAGHVPGGVVGSNFVDRPELSDADDESTNWIPGATEALRGVRFEFESGDPMAKARVRDADGRLDVVFAPGSRKDVKMNLVAVAIDYTQLGGTYDGTITSAAGVAYPVERTPGVLETMTTRF